MHPLSIAALLVFAAAVGGYAYLFRKRHRDRLQRLREADARLGSWVDPRYPPVSLVGPRVLPPNPSADQPWLHRPAYAPPRQLPGLFDIFSIILWVPFWMALLALGVLIPWLGTLQLLHVAGAATDLPLTGEYLVELLRHTFLVAVGMVLVGKIPGVAERLAGPMVLVMMALFSTSFLVPLIVSAGVGMALHAVVWPLWEIDVWREWRPFVHAAFAVLGVPWAIWMIYDVHRKNPPEGWGSGGYIGYPSRGSAGTAMAAGGALFFEFSRDSSWSDDSGGDGD